MIFLYKARLLCYTERKTRERIMFARLDEKLDEFLSLGVPWNDLVVYHKGKCVYRRFRGTLDLEGTVPVRGDERINIYSCSKVITCTAALMLYERGLFRLTDPLCDYLPEYAEMTVRDEDGVLHRAKNPIRILDLFRMTAGFTYHLRSSALNRLRRETKGVASTRDFARYHAEEPLTSEPGERWCYSLAHDVLAALCEVISDTEFNAFCKQNVFDAVGMPNTTFLLPSREYDTVAPHYAYNMDGCIAECGKFPIYRLGEGHASGGAGCVSTVDEYGRFLEALRTEAFLSENTLDLMSTDMLTDEHRVTYGDGDYGYGLGVRCPRRGSAVSDFGWGGAAGAYFMVDRKNEITAFYAQHVLNSPVQAKRGELRPIITEILCGEEAPRGENDKLKF